MLNSEDINGKVMDIINNNSKTFNAIHQNFPLKLKVGKMRSEKKIGFLRHEVSESPVEGSHYHTLYTKMQSKCDA